MEEQEIKQEEQKQEEQRQEKEVDIDSVIRQKLDEEAKALGYESWSDMQAKLLEEKGRVYELLEKTKKEAEEDKKRHAEELARLQRQYEETVIRYEALQHFRDAVDPEKALKLFKAEKNIYIKEGRLFADGEPIEKAVEKFLTENPYLLKPSVKQGAGTTPAAEVQQNLPAEERFKQAFKKLLGGR